MDIARDRRSLATVSREGSCGSRSRRRPGGSARTECSKAPHRSGAIRNTFEVVPDAPVSRFVLELKGGKKYGLLENSEDICAKAQKASVKLISQSGIVRSYKQKIQNSCGKKGTGGGKKGKHGSNAPKKHGKGGGKGKGSK